MPINRTKLAERAMATSSLTELLVRLDAWSGVLVLTYHRIGRPEESSLDPGVFSATPEDFETQMALLARHFDVIAAPEALHALGGPRSRAVIITFDDGYRDNFTHAYPSLRRLRLPATFFVTTGFVDRPQLPWWDEVFWRASGDSLAPRRLAEHLRLDLPAETPAAASAAVLERYKRLPQPAADAMLKRVRELTGEPAPSFDVTSLWMTWDMIREMRNAGMTVGAHTVTHPVLTAITEDEQDAEIGGSIERVTRETGRRTELFAYPVGLPFTYDGSTRRALTRHYIEY